MMFNLFKKNVNMKEVGQNKALTWSCYGVKSRITSIMEGKWTDNGTIVCSDWCGRSMAYDRLAGVTGTALRKIAAVFCLLMVVGVGDVWGWYLPGTIHYTAWDANANNMGGDNTITFYAVPAGTYECKLSDGTNFKNGDWTADSGGDGITIEYNGGNIKLTVSKEIDIIVSYASDDKVKITTSAPTYHIKYLWDGKNWTCSNAMTSNGDGTYSVVGEYHGSAFNYRKYQSDGDDFKSYNDGTSGVTIDGTTPSAGNKCVFTFKPSDNSLTIRKCNAVNKNTGTCYLYFDNSESNWSETYKYFVIGRPAADGDSYSVVHETTNITNTKLWYVSTSSVWDDAAYYGVISSSSAWDGTNWSWANLSTAAHYSAPYLSNFDLVKTHIYTISKAADDNSAIALTDKGTGTTNLNTTQTFNYALSTDGGVNYTVMASPTVKTPGQLALGSYKFTSGTYNGVTANSEQTLSANSGAATAYSKSFGSVAYTGTTTLTESNTRDGYTFMGWYNNNATQRTNSSTHSFTYYPQGDSTFTARYKAHRYQVRFNKNDSKATGEMSSQQFVYDVAQSLTSNDFTNTGYTFAGWATTPGGVVAYTDGESVSNLSSTDGDVVDLYAVWGREFSLVTSTSVLAEETEVVIVNSDGTKALSTTQNTNNRAATDIKLVDSKVIVPDEGPIQALKIVINGTYYSFYTGVSYLYAASSSDNHLKSQTTLNDNGKWTISLNGSYEATITAQGTNSRNVLQNNTNIFSCYASASQTAVKLYYCTSPFINESEDLTTFEYAVGYGPSTAQAISVKGYNLTGNLTVTAPTNYEVCLTESGTYTSSVTLEKDGSNKVNATFYVRLKAGKSVTSYNETLTISGGGSTPKSINLTGSVENLPAGSTGFKLVTNSVNIFPDDSIVILNASGTRLLSNKGDNNRTGARPTNNFSIIDQTVFVKNASDSIQKIKLEGCDDEWLFKVGDNSYLCCAESNTYNYLQAKTLVNAGNNGIWKIRINSACSDTITAKSGTNTWLWYNGSGSTNIFSCYSNPQTQLPKIYAKPSTVANVCGWPSKLTGFTVTSNGTGASTEQSFKVKARNISSGNVRVSAGETGYEVSLDNSTYNTYVDITPVSNSVAPTTVYVRLKANSGHGDHNGNITITGGGSERTIALEGTVTPLTVTYHSATEANHVVNVSYNGSVPAYLPLDCSGKVFVGWHTAAVAALQQTDPTTNATGAIANVTEDVELHAVFASKNGGKVTGTHTLTEDFESYTIIGNYGKAGLTFDNANGLSWQIDYGNVSTTQATQFGGGSTKDVVLSINNNTSNQLFSRAAVRDVVGISLYAGKATGKIDGYISFSNNGSSWGEPEKLNITSLIGSSPYVHQYTKAYTIPRDLYIRIQSVQAYTLGSGDNLFIDNIVFTIADRAYYYTDYSTTCDKVGSVTVTWEGVDGAVFEEPAAPSVGDWVTFPSITRANYRFDGWKATIEDDEKSHTYQPGEEFLVNHDVTFTAQWTRYIEDVAGVSPITSGKDISMRAIEIDSIVVNSETASTPTATVSGTDETLFTVTVDAANKRSAAGKTHFPYSVTYTPTEHGATHKVNVTFTCDGIESNAITVRGRSLPAEFVIAIKNGDKWVALPSDLDSTQTAQKSIQALEITVDNSTTPTKALFAPANTAYKTTGRYTPANTTCLRFTNADSRYLRVSGTESTYQMWMSKTGGTGTEDWQLKSTNFGVYELTIPSNNHPTKKMGLYNVTPTYMGYHTSPTNADIYLLPIETKATFYEAQKPTWTDNAIGLTLSNELDADAVTILNGADAATVNKIDDTHYTAIFETDFTALSGGEQLTLIWKKSGSAVGGSYVTVPSIIATDATTWDGISPTPSLNDVVVLKSPTTIGDSCVAKQVVLDQSGENSGELEIPAGKRLVVAQTIRKFDGTSFGATETSDITINSDKTNGLGTLVMGEHDGTNGATVNFYSKSYYDSSNPDKSPNQYVGTPFGNRPPMIYQFYNSWMYKFSNEDLTNVAWERINGDTPLEAFQGYCVISAENEMNDGHMFTMSGQLVASDNVTNNSIFCRITGDAGNTQYNNENMLANSWMAPIKINAFDILTDFNKVTGTIYIFNTGSYKDYNDEGTSTPTGAKPAQYSTYTIGTAANTDVIPPMQAFSVYAYGDNGEAGSITLDYKRLVYDPAVAGLDNKPNKAPRRASVEQEEANKMRMYVQGESGYGDMLYMWEHENFHTGFENGWDGGKLYGEDVAPQLYAISEDGKMAVNCVPSYEGVQIGFKAGTNDAVYTFTFEYEADAEVIYLHDKLTGDYTRVMSGNSYMFGTTDKDDHARFELTRNAPQVATGDVTVSGELSAVSGEAFKFVEDDRLLIYRDGKVYNATGVIVR